MVSVSRFPAPRPPEGLALPSGDLLWLGERLQVRQEQAFRAAGLSVGEGSGPRLLVREDAAVSASALRAFAAAGARAGRDLRWVSGGETGALVRTLGLGRDEPLLVYLRDGDAQAERIAAAEPLEMDPAERVLQAPLIGASFALPIADRLVLPAGHWAQLLWANLLGLGPHLWRRLLSPRPALALLKLAAAVVGARSTDPWRVAARLVRRGRGARIHPTATVEASVLGPGAVVGAGAVVRGSVLGPGAVVEEQALVEFSALGARARVLRKGMAKFCVIHPDAHAGGIMQLGVLGPGAITKYGAILMDQSFGPPVMVQVGDARVQAPFGLLGVCVGAGTTLGMGVLVAAGRVLPGGLTVIAPPRDMVRRVPAGLAGLVEVQDGTLVRR